MQKYLLYRKGVRMAAIVGDDVKRGAQSALSDWIGHERLLLEEAGEREGFTFRFVEMGATQQDTKAPATGSPSLPIAHLPKRHDIIPTGRALTPGSTGTGIAGTCYPLQRTHSTMTSSS
jgi:hypothetical protein